MNRFALFLLIGAALRSETLPSFEIATVKPFDRVGVAGHGSTAISGPRVSLTNYSLNALIMYAYDVRNYQVSGGPGWVNSDAFVITAKVEGDATPSTAKVREMLQTLLAERFGLKLHKEMKETSVYLLVPAKNGNALPPSQAQRATMQTGPGRLMVAKFTMTQAASLLSSIVSKPVLDRTEMPGEFDFTLTSPDINMSPMQAASDIPGPSIFTAVQEQLGLKLEPSKGMIEVLVIDRASKPSEN